MADVSTSKVDLTLDTSSDDEDSQLDDTVNSDGEEEVRELQDEKVFSGLKTLLKDFQDLEDRVKSLATTLEDLEEGHKEMLIQKLLLKKECTLANNELDQLKKNSNLWMEYFKNNPPSASFDEGEALQIARPAPVTIIVVEVSLKDKEPNVHIEHFFDIESLENAGYMINAHLMLCGIHHFFEDPKDKSIGKDIYRGVILINVFEAYGVIRKLLYETPEEVQDIIYFYGVFLLKQKAFSQENISKMRLADDGSFQQTPRDDSIFSELDLKFGLNTVQDD
ncbi:hypothetical protein JHK87_033917 [Glycine soja]|nr:hypothetical protein JHK87_033917 [Glycine soja]